MSAGLFAISKYASTYNGGAEIHPIRVQPETLAATTGLVDNDPPSGTLTSPISAKVSGGSRAVGLTARRVRLKYKSGTVPPGGYTTASRTEIPALTEAFYAGCVKGTEVTYLGAIWSVTGRSPEVVG